MAAYENGVQLVYGLSYKELTLSRANKSVRVFDHVVESLSNGDQPDIKLLSKVSNFCFSSFLE